MTEFSGLASAGRRVRVGCDVAAVAGVAASVEHFGDRFLRRVFTPGELRDCAGEQRIQRLAARFAAKEAVIKAFADPTLAYPPTLIEVVSDDGLPRLVLHDSLARAAGMQGWREISLSLAHEDCHAMAVVAVVCE